MVKAMGSALDRCGGDDDSNNDEEMYSEVMKENKMLRKELRKLEREVGMLSHS